MPELREPHWSAGTQEVIDLLPCGYLTTSSDGVIRQANATVLRWLGYSHDDVVGTKRFTDLLSGGSRIYHETNYRPTLELHGEAHEIAIELVTAAGHRVPALLTSALDGAASEAPGRVRSALFKATERRSYERELLLARERAERSEAEALTTARTLQQTLIPPAPPSIVGLDLAVAFRPAGDGGMIGGDFYDVFELTSGEWIVVVGDVCGKGVEAAAFAALVRHLVRAEAVHTRQLDDVLAAVNRRLLEHGADRYCTMVLARFSNVDGAVRITLSLGGHPPPLVAGGDGTLITLGQPGSLVGSFANGVYRQIAHALSPGDTVVLYTDGVTEGRANGELFGEDRLQELVGRSDAASLAADIVEAVLAFQFGISADDVAVVTVSVPRR